METGGMNLDEMGEGGGMAGMLGISHDEEGGGDSGSPEPVPADMTDDAGKADAQDAAESDPFDIFNVEGDEAGEDDGQENPEEGGEGEYSLELGDNFQGTDETRGMITALAKECGLPADAASKFVSSVCDRLAESLKEERAESIKALRDEWKGKYDSRVKETRVFINRMMKDGKISESVARSMQSADAFRFANAVREMMGERRSAGTRTASGSGMSRDEELKDIMENPNNQHFKNLSNPNSPGYRDSAAYFNKLAGARIY